MLVPYKDRAAYTIYPDLIDIGIEIFGWKCSSCGKILTPETALCDLVASGIIYCSQECMDNHWDRLKDLTINFS